MGDEKQNDHNQDTGMTYEEKLERKFEALDDLARDFAKAEAERSYLDHFRHSLIAKLMKQVLSIDPKINTLAGQEREARAHPDYIALLKGLKVATEEAEKCRWLLKNAHVRASIYQTRQANKRAQTTMR